MLRKVTIFFESFISTNESTLDPQHSLNLAVAALLVEMVRVDNNVSNEEVNHLNAILIERFGIAPTEIEEITALAEDELSQSTDYYQFTSLINTHFERPQKMQMIKTLWEIAYIDGKIDSHEEHYLRKIAELLHVPHSEFIRTKLEVENSFSK